jgi:site-specific recombinase XerD
LPRTTTTTTARVVDDLALNAAAFDHHLDAEGKSPATRDAYTKATTQLEGFLARQGMPLVVGSIRREHIESFLIHMRERGMAPATVAQRYRSIQQFFKFLLAEGEIRETPLRNISPPKVPDNPPPVVTLDEMRSLLRTCDGTTFADRRDAAILSLFYDSGMRRAEMAGIRVSDLDQAAKSVTVTGKGRRQRTVRYGPDMARTLDRYLRRRAEHHFADSDLLWLGERGPLSVFGIEQVVQRRAQNAGLPHVHCHLFRHAFADSYLSSGGNEGDLMQLAGWRSRQMVDRYARAVAADRARRNYDPHSPLAKLRRG